MNYSNPIAFPGLGLGPWDPSPVAFAIMGREFRWYGIIIALGFLLAALYGAKRAPAVGLTGDDIMDVLLYATPAGIIGARLYYVLFNFGEFVDDPMRMFYIWTGGMAVYGSIIGAVLAAVIFCRIKKLPVFAMLDIGALGLLIGQCIGRWGNFMNREAYGYVTELPWRMEISWQGVRYAVHPTFLYESLWNLAGFLLLHFLLTKRTYNGQIFLGYVAWYGLGRAFIEGLRTDSLYLFGSGLRISQVFGLVTCAAALAILTVFFVKKKGFPEKKEALSDGDSDGRQIISEETQSTDHSESGEPESGGPDA